ncbi:MAG TPA: class I SAM-dependent methyltransferase [Pseudolabrys sp.]|nr:class I SAM-dependent methyltransferase [Pseudolabrys sp.]
MNGFSADWLALREPYDLRARSREVIAAVAASVAALPSIHIVDLACGTGATVRALTGHLQSRQVWRLADNDLGLLGRANAMALGDNVKITAVPLDLNRDLEAALDGAVDLVTTSAFIDLVSKNWLDRLTTEIAARSIPFYAALTYDGRIDITPNDPADASIVAAINKHQATDKGFGPALGPEAAAYAIGAFERLGYTVTHRQSDWTMGPNDRDIQLEIFAGWAGAAREIGSLSLAETASWLTRRRAGVAAGTSSLCVGHVDLFAIPTGRR